MIPRKQSPSPWRSLLSSVLLLAPLTTVHASQSVADIERASNQSLLWGPYRPNLYFGVRPRIPESILMGLLWSKVEDYQSVQHNFRHTCEQHEGMAGYGWETYDPRHGGVQTVHDAGNQIDVTTSFFKDTSDAAGNKGGNWGVRIKGVPRADAPEDLKTTMIFYASIEGKPGVYNRLEVKSEEEEAGAGFEGDVVLQGENIGLGEYKIVVKGDGDSDNRHPSHTHPSGSMKDLGKTFVHSSVLPEEAIWQTKPILFAVLKNQIDEYIEKYTQENPPPPFQLYTVKSEPGHGNNHFVQKVFEGAFEFDVLFSSSASTSELSSPDLTAGISKITESFDKRFESLFKPKAPFNSGKYLEFSKSLFSNLLGGIGYFYGDWKVDRSYAPEYEEENEGFWEEAAEARARAPISTEGPVELFSSIPSRPFFPRGFLWDEGFHLMPVVEWDVDLTLQIVKSWFALIDEDGWIAREQILGPEARSKVPAEFQTQYPHYANPPTLFFILSTFVDKLTSATESGDAEYSPQLLDKTVATSYLQELYPLLKRHYNWFRKTQQGDIASYDRNAVNTKEGYRWRGRTPRHILPSGLDDFPRAQPPHPGELHVDAISWVGLMATSLSKIGSFLNEDEDVATFKKQLAGIKSNIADLHWSEKDGVFCDATIDEFEENSLVCHKGYISLFPFMLGLLDHAADSKKITKILATIGDTETLWSDHGIRSLSKLDEAYGTDENYWRSPVWINMNYLILSRLLALAEDPKAGSNQATAKKLYTDLRSNLVETVYKSWKDTGFAWEQYNPETGAGQRTQHFTGWTSLVVRILGMPDLSGGSVKIRDEL